ncbi:TnsA-like heteromeric transposase endonuclease subunit [Pseudonocardia terrae]|uniref:TnsA-like heteromeric transposase endonuclease subunit n=1 Tax=Pseudonocardia terrae TaxID=2905831 RepID=UPI001E4D99F6|nr:TnsA-like heteromeric transposase endonuclease subunit [Pseudonocardia terrae]
MPFERVAPVRSFPSYQGQRNYPGFYYAATLDAHVVFESWLERDTAMALDFEPEVVGFAAQPFWLTWAGTDRARSHAPDFFARTAAGTGVVVDCRPAPRVRPRDAEAFAATERACAEVGWQYRLVTGHDPVWLTNLRWLAGYRHRRCYRDLLVAPLLDVFATARPLVEGAARVGDPIAVLPTLFHLLWSGRLATDMTARLESTSLVAVPRVTGVSG